MKKYFLLLTLYLFSNLGFAQQTPLQVTARIDTNVYQNSQKKIRGDSMNAVLKAILGAYHVPPLLNNGLLAGGTVTWVSDYIYDISAAVYVINDTLYTSFAIQDTLDSADVSDDRIDLFVLTTSGIATHVTGIAASPALEPDIDASTQLKIAFALVAAGTTEPTPSLPIEYIYLENTEWTTAVSAGTIDPASTNNPYGGSSVDIEGTAVANGNYITLTPVTFPGLITFDSFVFKIRSKAAWNTASRLVFQFQNGTTNVGTAVPFGNNSFGFISSTTGIYQNINIPLSAFGNIGAATRLKITKTGGSTIGWYIDNVQFMGNNQIVIQNQAQTDWTQTNTLQPDYIRNKPIIPKRYVANLRQDTTAAPVATVMLNTLGTVTWSRIMQGEYRASSAGLFTSGKTTILISNNADFGVNTYARSDYVNASIIEVYAWNPSAPADFDGGVPQDNILSNCTIVIEVWP